MTIPSAAAGAYSAARNLMSSGAGAGAGAGVASATAPGAGSFGQMLSGALDSVSQAGRSADTQVMAAASGRTNLVDVVTAVAESETALQTLVAVRDRVISAYEEIMRMPI